MKPWDLAILGGGTAGMVAAIGAAGTGARVLLVEQDRLGGDCLYTGCVPSKSLIAAAQRVRDARTADEFGVRIGDIQVDFPAVMAHVHDVIAQIEPKDSPDRLRAEGVEVVIGRGQFTGPDQLDVDGQSHRFRHALVATGSEPTIPAVPGLPEADPLTSDSIWNLTELPERLLVMGAGRVGCELGQAFQRLGSQVTMACVDDRALHMEPPMVSRLIGRRLLDEGIDLRLSTTFEHVDGDTGKALLATDGVTDTVPFDRILVATGRRARTAGIGLDTTGVELDGAGNVVVDEYLRTTAKRIWAAGDLTGRMPFTHIAGAEGSTVVMNALFGLRRKMRYDRLPWVLFTDPEVARIGLSFAEAHDRYGHNAGERIFHLDELDRALTARKTEGFAQLVTGPRGRIVGATIVGERAGESIAEVAAWMANRGSITRFSQTVHAYPTFSEAPFWAAMEDIRRRLRTPGVRAVTKSVLGLGRLLDRKDDERPSS
ncbi:MAG: FAD-dependent oxidoreductase [Nitriliruptorales bacterium]|nr:FAD-dependent oxidoreductase [Nitriliruptorales bacterium]